MNQRRPNGVQSVFPQVSRLLAGSAVPVAWKRDGVVPLQRNLPALFLSRGHTVWLPCSPSTSTYAHEQHPLIGEPDVPALTRTPPGSRPGPERQAGVFGLNAPTRSRFPRTRALVFWANDTAADWPEPDRAGSSDVVRKGASVKVENVRLVVEAEQRWRAGVEWW
jgi:hypothetical protein